MEDRSTMKPSTSSSQMSGDRHGKTSTEDISLMRAGSRRETSSRTPSTKRAQRRTPSRSVSPSGANRSNWTSSSRNSKTTEETSLMRAASNRGTSSGSPSPKRARQRESTPTRSISPRAADRSNWTSTPRNSKTPNKKRDLPTRSHSPKTTKERRGRSTRSPSPKTTKEQRGRSIKTLSPERKRRRRSTPTRSSDRKRDGSRTPQGLERGRERERRGKSSRDKEKRSRSRCKSRQTPKRASRGTSAGDSLGSRTRLPVKASKPCSWRRTGSQSKDIDYSRLVSAPNFAEEARTLLEAPLKTKSKQNHSEDSPVEASLKTSNRNHSQNRSTEAPFKTSNQNHSEDLPAECALAVREATPCFDEIAPATDVMDVIILPETEEARTLLEAPLKTSNPNHSEEHPTEASLRTSNRNHSQVSAKSAVREATPCIDEIAPASDVIDVIIPPETESLGTDWLNKLDEIELQNNVADRSKQDSAPNLKIILSQDDKALFSSEYVEELDNSKDTSFIQKINKQNIATPTNSSKGYEERVKKEGTQITLVPATINAMLRQKVKSEMTALSLIQSKDFGQFVEAYLDYIESRGEESTADEVDEALTQIQMLGCTFEELRKFVRDAKQSETRTEEDWSGLFEANFPGYKYCKSIISSFPLILNVLLFDNNQAQKSEKKLFTKEANENQQSDKASKIGEQRAKQTMISEDGPSEARTGEIHFTTSEELVSSDTAGEDLFSSAMELVARKSEKKLLTKEANEKQQANSPNKSKETHQSKKRAEVELERGEEQQEEELVSSEVAGEDLFSSAMGLVAEFAENAFKELPSSENLSIQSHNEGSISADTTGEKAKSENEDVINHSSLCHQVGSSETSPPKAPTENLAIQSYNEGSISTNTTGGEKAKSENEYVINQSTLCHEIKTSEKPPRLEEKSDEDGLEEGEINEDDIEEGPSEANGMTDKGEEEKDLREAVSKIIKDFKEKDSSKAGAQPEISLPTKLAVGNSSVVKCAVKEKRGSKDMRQEKKDATRACLGHTSKGKVSPAHSAQRDESITERKVIIAEEKKPRKKIVFSDSVGCQLQDLDLDATGICRFRDRELGCTNAECRFTHRKPEHMVHFETQDFSYFHNRSEYERYNREYLQARDDLRNHCGLCKAQIEEVKREKELLKRKVHPGLIVVKPSEKSAVNQEDKSEPLLKKFNKRQESFDLRKKLGKLQGAKANNQETRSSEERKNFKLCEEKAEIDLLQLKLSSEDEDFFKERTESEMAKQGRKVTQEDEIMRIQVPHTNADFERTTERRNVTYKSDIMMIQKEDNNERAIVDGTAEDQEMEDVASGSRNVLIASSLKDTREEKTRLPVHQRIGQKSTWSTSDSSSAKFVGPSRTSHEDEEVQTFQTRFLAENVDQDSMIQELTNFLIHQPNQECKMSDIHQFSMTSTFQPSDFGYSRWIELLSTIDTVSIVHMSVRLKPGSLDLEGGDSKKVKRQVMVKELRDFLFHEPEQECPMNEIHRFGLSSTYKPEDFESRWSELLPTLNVATILGHGKEKVLLLKAKHYRVALSHFKRNVTELLVEHGPMSLAEVNLHLFGEDSLVENGWISDCLKDCYPEIK